MISPVAAACSAIDTAPQPAKDALMTQANTARDGNIAIREEFDRAIEIDTVAGWKLFLARHPGHPLADQATARLRQAATRIK